MSFTSKDLKYVSNFLLSSVYELADKFKYKDFL